MCIYISLVGLRICSRGFCTSSAAGQFLIGRSPLEFFCGISVYTGPDFPVVYRSEAKNRACTTISLLLYTGLCIPDSVRCAAWHDQDCTAGPRSDRISGWFLSHDHLFLDCGAEGELFGESWLAMEMSGTDGDKTFSGDIEPVSDGNEWNRGRQDISSDIMPVSDGNEWNIGRQDIFRRYRAG